MNAAELLRDAVVVDGHTDVPTRLFHRPADLRERLEDGHVDLPRLRDGGVGALVFALYVPGALAPAAGWEHALALYDRIERQLRPGELELVASAAAVRRAAAEGAVGVLLGLENGRPLQVPSALARCSALGIRYVTLTHNETHEWCDSATDEARHGGLSDDGVRIVREMVRRGILIDVSHVSDAAVLHALDATRAPLIASHSSCRALCGHPRNLPDSLIREIARRGGVVMANCVPAFLDDRAAEASRARLAEYRRRTADLSPDDLAAHRAVEDAMAPDFRLPAVPLSRFADHLVHLVEVAGEEHVGIGTDFDGTPEVPVGFEDVSRFPALVEELQSRGLPPATLRQILGENLLRVLRDAERLAA